MASCEGNGLSDERIGEALIKEVIQEELKEVPTEEVPPFTPLTKEVKSEQEQKIVVQLADMIRIIGDTVKEHKEFQDAIDGMISSPGCVHQNFMEVVSMVFDHGQITWERIAVLFYVAGRLAVKMVLARLPQSVVEILKYTLDYFRSTLLGWIRDHGGWINSFSELARVPMERMSSMTSTYAFILIFIAGIALGSFLTWKMTKRT